MDKPIEEALKMSWQDKLNIAAMASIVAIAVAEWLELFLL